MSPELKIKLAIQSLEEIREAVKHLEQTHKTVSIKGTCDFTIKALKDEEN